MTFLLSITLLALIDFNSATTSGLATHYGGNLNGNACGMYDGTADAFGNWAYAAIGSDNFDDGYGCGKCYTIKCNGPYGNNPNCNCDTSKTLTIQAIDECGGCDNNHFDLNMEAMNYFTGSASMSGLCGKLSIEYERVDCSDITSNFKITNKEGGTSTDWYAFYLEDVNADGSIKSVELLKDGSSITTCDKSQGSSYWVCNNGQKIPGLSTPIDIKITSDLGKSVTAEGCITSLVSGTVMRCNTNLGDTDSDSSGSGGSDGSSSNQIEIKQNDDVNVWWIAIEFPNNDNSAITKLEFQDSNHNQWISGTYEEWGTGAYSFNDGTQFSGNQHFRVTTNDGNTAETYNIFNGLNGGSTAYINLP